MIRLALTLMSLLVGDSETLEPRAPVDPADCFFAAATGSRQLPSDRQFEVTVVGRSKHVSGFRILPSAVFSVLISLTGGGKILTPRLRNQHNRSRQVYCCSPSIYLQTPPQNGNVPDVLSEESSGEKILPVRLSFTLISHLR
jgi:hypothetical protein